MGQALKCSIEVVAGVLVGVPMKEYSRQWHITEEDWINPPTYIDKSGAAMNYAMSLQNPQRFNWVRMDWIWY